LSAEDCFSIAQHEDFLLSVSIIPATKGCTHLFCSLRSFLGLLETLHRLLRHPARQSCSDVETYLLLALLSFCSVLAAARILTSR